MSAITNQDFYINVPKEDLSLFKKLAHKMGWTFTSVKEENNSPIAAEEDSEYITKNEMIEGIKTGLRDVKEGKTRSIDELLNEL